jgi:micrococcal nuclease
VSDTDKYGRLLRYVYVDEKMINAKLVSTGMAEARAYPPDTRYRELLDKLEKEAKDKGRGMWVKQKWNP